MWLLFVVFTVLVSSDGGVGVVQSTSDLEIPGRAPILVLKCCREGQHIDHTGHCNDLDHFSGQLWEPKFSTESGNPSSERIPLSVIRGHGPNCRTEDMWRVYSYPSSTDLLMLLTNGRLRHFVRHQDPTEHDDHRQTLFEIEHEVHPEERYYDYDYPQFCIDNATLGNGKSGLFAMVCKPRVVVDWSDGHFVVHRVVDPICRAIAMMILLTIAVIYFILPQLRDLVGNIVTTITVCLIVAQAADLVRTFTEFNKHVSFFAADLIVYTALMAAFFWINSMGYYVWRQFKSRDVFLRMTDGRKYCYYACYVWGCTLTLVLLACFTHFTFSNADPPPAAICSTSHKTIGWIGIAVFFLPVACLVIANLFFWRSTAHIISRISSFGRIHDKLKYSFEMFVRISLIMTVAWFTLMLTWFQVRFLCYTYIVVNLLQAILLLYVCVLSQSRVTLLLRKTCCYEHCICPCCRPGEPAETCEWGEDMVYMNTLNNY